MTALTPEAVAVIEGRHADPFRYLGPHIETALRSCASSSPMRERSPRSARRHANIRWSAFTSAGLFVGQRQMAVALSAARAFRRSRGRNGRPLSVSAGPVRSRSVSAGRGHASPAL